jgi:hypothetical protein
MVYIGFFISKSISNIAVFLYPAYITFKALTTVEDTDDKRWLKYWTLVGFLTMFEYYLEFLVMFLPFYFEIKILFILWMIHPFGKFDGCNFIYAFYIEPFLSSREKAIDQLLVDFGLGSLLTEPDAPKQTSWETQAEEEKLQQNQALVH